MELILQVMRGVFGVALNLVLLVMGSAWLLLLITLGVKFGMDWHASDAIYARY